MDHIMFILKAADMTFFNRWL